MSPFGVDISDKRALARQIMRFMGISGIAFMIDWALLYAFTDWIGIPYLYSNVLSFTLSTALNYFMSTRWVFDVADGHRRHQDFAVFLVLSIFGLGISQGLMFLFTDVARIHYLLSKLGAGVIGGVFNFITRKIFLEREMRERESRRRRR